ncbi:MAG TPA: hypothetical protein VIS03_15170 [Kiloniellaceae bacterium]
MRHDHRCRLAARDFHILQAMLAERSGRDDPLLPLLRQKLSSVTILPPHEVPPDLVTLYSRVRYRVNQRPPTTRVMIHDAAQGVIGATLPITHPRGLALLGFAEGVTVTVPDMAGMPETISIEEVLYQPQAAGRAALA